METALAVLLIFFVIMLICREATCWYLKINETLGVLREILTELKRLNSQVRFK
jgi:hypothetical protein